MKKTFIILFTGLFLTSCSVVMHPKFTNVDSLLNVNRGESINKVIDKIGFMPYDIYVQETTGYKIVTYKYKIKEREIAPESKDFLGSEKSGNEKYVGKLHDVYFVFDVNDKLITFITDNGRDDGHSVLRDDEKIINFKDYMNSANPTNSAAPVMMEETGKKKKKGKKLNPLL